MEDTHIIDDIYVHDWFDEYIKNVPSKKKLYKFMCFFLGKRNGLKYKEMYMLIEFLNRKQLKKQSKEYAMLKVVALYKFNNNKLPYGFNLER